MRWFRFAVLVLVASLLQTGLVGALAILRPDFKPDLLLILLVFFALRSNPTDAIISPRRAIYQAVTIFLMGGLTAGLSYLLTFLRIGAVPTDMAAGCFWQPLYSAFLGPVLFLPVGWCMHMYGRGRRRYLRGALARH
jgi:hypothetical protein